ncbi:MAG TPA: flavin reductase [Spirochaetia bacterium]|nr:flavin reductase [Spirochaetia bacterium]
MALNLSDFDVENIEDNVFRRIGEGWMLITAGDEQGFNMMTASWGGLGVLWSKRVAFCFVRPHRYTFEFMERSSVFSLSFFDESHRSELTYCGEHSGREVDKVAGSGLTPLHDPLGAVYFAEAELVLVSRKIYFQDLTPANFLDAAIAGNYPEEDYHRMYVGEIIRSLRK